MPVDVLRKGHKQTVRLTVLKLTDDKPMHAPAPQKAVPRPVKGKSKLSDLGLSLAAIDADARAQFKLPGNLQGVVVTDVTAESPAAEKNFRAGDVIVQVAGQNVRTPADIAQHIDADAKAGKKVELMLVNRGGDLTYVAVKLG